MCVHAMCAWMQRRGIGVSASQQRYGHGSDVNPGLPDLKPRPRAGCLRIAGRSVKFGHPAPAVHESFT
jgi:hypothetical protein